VRYYPIAVTKFLDRLVQFKQEDTCTISHSELIIQRPICDLPVNYRSAYLCPQYLIKRNCHNIPIQDNKISLFPREEGAQLMFRERGVSSVEGHAFKCLGPG